MELERKAAELTERDIARTHRAPERGPRAITAAQNTGGRSVDQLVAQEAIAATLRNALPQNRESPPAYLSVRGHRKTPSARILARR